MATDSDQILAAVAAYIACPPRIPRWASPSWVMMYSWQRGPMIAKSMGAEFIKEDYTT